MESLKIRKDLELKSGLIWIKRAFIIFRERPVHFLILQFFYTILTLVPFLGAFLTPLIQAKIMYFAARTEINAPLKINDIFKGVFSKAMVIRLAFLNFCISAILMLIQMYLESKFGVGNSNIGITSFGLILILTVPSLILAMAMWLSPAICLNHDNIEPKTAMWLSLKASAQNILALLLYSITLAGIWILIVIPIGWFLVWLWSAKITLAIIIPCAILGFIIVMFWSSIVSIATYFVYKRMYTAYT